MLATLSGEQPYQVKLPVFEGPLDLLLQLIEREKLDISAISLALVADQFIEYVKTTEMIEAETLADFLVMAARLVWIKSRVLLPQQTKEDAEEEEDPAEALARQLRDYKRFKALAAQMKEIEALGRHTYIRVAPPPDIERRLDTSDLTLDDLISAALTAFLEREAEPAVVPKGVVIPFTLTIRDQVRRIKEITAGGRSVSFLQLLGEARHRVEIIVTLLAVLELIKRHQVHVAQEGLFSQIMISAIEGVEITMTPEPNSNGNGNGTEDEPENDFDAE